MTDRLRFDLSGLARACTWALVVFMMAELAYAANSIAFYGFLDAVEAGTLSDAEIDSFDARTNALTYAHIGIFLIAAVLSAVWIYRASWNARQIHPVEGRITPGWAVGWAFVPIMNLWKPYQAIAQTWTSSHDPKAALTGSMPGFAGWWWGTWIVMSILNRGSGRMLQRAETLDDYRLANTIELIATPMALTAAVLFIRIITSITEAQRDKRPAVGPLPDQTAPGESPDQS